ncbi:MAG: hypothetical protein KOO62_11545 [candidate division Zixibacteria bacterium]|nr:hypothetical protein [candidate division Zixibacteria bacterium]
MLVLYPASIHAGQVSTREAVENIYYYFDLLVSDNLESARNLWTESVIERSERFGIEYDDIPIKLDCSSPVMQDLPTLRDQLYRSIRKMSGLDGSTEYFTGEYSATLNNQKVTHLYYTYYDGDYFWLTHAQDYYGRDWTVIESKYFRIRCHPDRIAYLNPTTLAEADHFVSDMAESLGMLRADLKTFQEKKIEYYYCPSDSVVKLITGFRTRGMLDLPTNDVISAYFPHFHEVAHLLINVRLKQLPLYTLPLLQEGLAVYLGGRWGKSTETLNYLAGFLQDHGLVEIDSIITMELFKQMATADMSYPVAGLFTAYVVDAIGMDKYLELYRSLSGTNSTLSKMDVEAVHKIFCETLEEPDWLSVMQSYGTYAERQLGKESAFAPGGTVQGRKLLETDDLVVTEDKEWVSILVTGGGQQPPSGDLFFGLNEELVGQHSLLFDEQHSDSKPLIGYRYCIRFDANEAGLYDFATNQLLGKFINGLTPSDEYFFAEGSGIALKFRKELSGKVVPKKGDFELILK